MRIDANGAGQQLTGKRATTIEEQLSKMEELQRAEYLKPQPAVKAAWGARPGEPDPAREKPTLAKLPEVELTVNRAAVIQAYKEGMKLPDTKG